MKFDWDQQKAKTNFKKHGVSFEEAKEALTCETVVVLKQDSNSDEERFIYLGMCKKLNVLVVVVTYPDEDMTRIISARKANKRERKYYETQL